MTMTDETTGQRERLAGRKLANALNLLLSDMADMVDDTFPHDANPASSAYLLNYEAHRSAYAAVRHVLTAVPAQAGFRAKVYDYVEQAWNLTNGQPEHDDVASRCIGRAADDYKPDTPEQLTRPRKVDRKSVALAPKGAKP